MHTGCASLALENGDISFSDALFAGSVATHTCDRENGYMLSGVSISVMESTRTCSEEGGWSGTEIICECKLCVHVCVHILSGADPDNVLKLLFASVHGRG